MQKGRLFVNYSKRSYRYVMFGLNFIFISIFETSFIKKREV